MNVTNIRAKLIALGACMAAGCSVLSPQPDRSRFFILSPVSDASAMSAGPASTSADSQLTIGVGPVDFPAYLRRLPVVTRVAPNRVEISDDKRWAEPLDKNFTRVLSENLATLLNTPRIEKYPWPLNIKVDYQVEIDVQRFETTGDGRSELIAGWIIRDGASGKILYASRTATGSPAGADEASASAALSDDLATLSKDIASRVTELNQHRTPNNPQANAAATL
ncbi:MAG TPA: PqiC family protein [Candidatus Binataceae bacterium]|nr:PqiC family protein [Candidatus Binataceae bacterium]HVB82336.1 PqiC family protein [Candidatus Binataceae bacterium]